MYKSYDIYSSISCNRSIVHPHNITVYSEQQGIVFNIHITLQVYFWLAPNYLSMCMHLTMSE